MTWKAYPAYRESGIGWLGKVPVHWSVERVKWAAKLESGHTPAKKLDEYWDEGDIPWASLNDTRYLKEHDYIGDTLWHITPLGLANSSARILPAQAVIFTRDASIGLCAITTRPMAVSQHIIAWLCRPQLLPDYLLRVFYSMTQELERLTMGATVKTIGMPDVSQLVTPIPPEGEQRGIVGFVQEKTRHIDALIAKKQRLIELLQEKRAAIISHAVTKGLDPTVPMKDSGIEWLGKIPKHWDVTRLKWMSTFVTSGSRGWAQYYDEEGSKFLRIGNLSRESVKIDLADVQCVKPPVGAETERTRVRPNDVLISITAYIGSIGVVPLDIGEAYINQHIALVRPVMSRVDPTWIAFSLVSQLGKDQFAQLLYGGTKDGLGLEDVKDLVVPIPPLAEQETVKQYLLDKENSIDASVGKIREGIDRLNEYRTALISAAVTGKIDVRNHLPTTTES